MKLYFITAAAMICMAACNGKQNAQEPPIEVEEETYAIVTAAPEAPSLPLIHSKKVEEKSKPVNLRDSLKTDPKKGAVIQKRYKGTMASPNSIDVDYDLTLYYQQDGDNEDGVFELDAIYVEPETETSNGSASSSSKKQKRITTGQRKVKHGSPEDANAVIYELIPSDGEPIIYFQVEGNQLTLMDQALRKAADDLNYTLTEVY